MSEATIVETTTGGKLVAGIKAVIMTSRRSLIVIEKSDGYRRINRTRLLSIKRENSSPKFSEIWERRILSEDSTKHKIIRAKT